MKDTEIMQTGETVVKSRGRGGKENFPSVIAGAKSEDIKRVMGNCLRWYGRTIVKDDEEARQRLYDFFIQCQENGELPIVEKMCMALGTVKQVVWQWEQGMGCSSTRTDLIKKGKEFIATFESEMVSEGKINPVVYIFRAKNFFGMKDVQDVVLTPNNPLGDTPDESELRRHIQGGTTLEAEVVDEQ